MMQCNDYVYMISKSYKVFSNCKEIALKECRMVVMCLVCHKVKDESRGFHAPL